MTMTYAESIMRATAALEITQVPYPISQHLDYAKQKYAAGEYRPHLSYREDGVAEVNKTFRDSVTIRPPDDADMSLDLYERVVEYVSRSFNMVHGDEIGAASTELFAYPPGIGIKMHVDDHVRDKVSGKLIASDPYRGITVILYLNDEFEGGEIYFNKQDKLIKPAPGTLVMFPSNRYFTHEVKPITSGMRFSYQRMYSIFSGASGKLLA